MAAAEAKNSTWKKRESLPSALIQIVLVGLVLAGAVWVVVGRGNHKKEVLEKLKVARQVAIKDNPADLAEASQLAEEILKTDPDSPEVLSTLAALYTERWLTHREPGTEAKAKDYLARSEKADSKSDDRYGTKALHIVASGDAKAAETFVEELRRKGASTAKLSYAQGLAFKAQGNLQMARASMATAADKAWRDPQYAAAFAEAWLEEGQYLPALEYFNKALANNAEHFLSKIGMSIARIGRKDRVGDAVSTLKEVQSKESHLSPALKSRLLAAQAELANFEAQPDAAITLADQALAINSNEPWALFAKAKAQAAKKDAAAPKSFEELVAKNRSAPVFYFEGASALQKAGNLESALALLDKYEETFKSVSNATADGKTQSYLERDDRYWLARGDVLRDSGRLDDALAAYDKAVAAKNIYLARATYAKGSVYLAKKDFAKAAEQLAVITPTDGSGAIPEAYVAMGEILFAKKDWAQGCQNYAFALSKFKAQSLPRERLNDMVADVEKKLIAAGQKPVAKAWVTEARPLIQ